VTRVKKTQHVSLLQIFVRVTDSGTPPLSDTEVFTVTVQRNLNPPVFNPLTYLAEIQENHQVGNGIGVTVRATDADISVSYFV